MAGVSLTAADKERPQVPGKQKTLPRVATGLLEGDLVVRVR